MAAAQVCFRPKGSDVCPVHPGNKVRFECEYCPGTLVCSCCITSTHKGHVFRDIKEALQGKTEKIVSFIQKTKQETLPGLVQQKDKTSREIKENNQLCQAKIQQVKQHGEKLKEEIDLNTSTTVSRLEFLFTGNNEILERHQTAIERLETQLQEEIKDLQQTLKDGKDTMVYDTGTKVSKTIEVPSMPTVTIATFSPCIYFKVHIEKAVGDMKVVKFLDQPKTLYEKVVSYEMSDICPTTENMAWTSSGSENVSARLSAHRHLRLIDNRGAKRNKITVNMDVNRICIHPTTGDVYCSLTNKRRIGRINTETGTSTAMFKTEYLPFSIACMTDDRMVVSSRDEERSKVVVYMYRMTGKCLRTHVCRGNLAPGLAVRHHDQTNDIAVLAFTEGVTVLTDSFQEVYTYKGEGSDKKKSVKFKPFKCCDAVFVSEHLLVADANNNMIHILTAATGNCIKIIKTDEMFYVRAIGVQQNGVLWVGSQSPNRLLCVKYDDLQ